MATVIEAIYEKGVFRPLQKPKLQEHQKVRLQVELTTVKEPIPPWGTYEGWVRTFEEMPQDAGVDDAEWAKMEAEMKEAELADLERTLAQTKRLLGE